MDKELENLNNLIISEDLEEGKTETIENPDQVEIGQWYWVKDDDVTERRKSFPITSPEGKNLLMCVTNVGSNYIGLESPRNERSYYSERVHFNDFYERLIHEPNADKIIEENIQHHRKRVRGQLEHVKRIQQEFGIPTERLLVDKTKGNGTSLIVAEQGTDLVEYKKGLVNVKKYLLPKLFKRIKQGNQILAQWMAAQTISLKANVESLEEIIDGVDNQIFNVSLYAGLAEDIILVKDGDPADNFEKIHIMQRMMFMDEECLVDYDAGGMEFKRLKEFDAWLLRNDNWKRLLPFDKCIGVFRVRRNTKERYSRDLHQAYINFQLAQMDRYTYMYCRNGENLYRVSIENFDFDEKLFPNEDEFPLGKPMMFRKFASRIEEMITVDDFEQRCKEYDEKKEKAEQWEKENPDESHIFNPHRLGSDPRFNYQPFDPDSVYYDDVLKKIQTKILKFNRMSLIIQGILDRSDTFYPHPPIKTYEPESFSRWIKPVYDADMVLTYGDPPDIEEYIKSCNEKANGDSVFLGQNKKFWERQNKKDEESYYKRYHYGNPGPAKLDKPCRWKPRAKKATFSWYRERQDWRRYDEYIECFAEFHVDELFNISGYTPGDYKKFYQDPRTRQEYLKWAPLLLTAEDYHAGKIEIGRDYRQGIF